MNPSTEKIGNAQLLKLNKTTFLCSDYWNLEIKEKSVKKVRITELAGNAYLPWEKEADEYLMSLYKVRKKYKGTCRNL